MTTIPGTFCLLASSLWVWQLLLSVFLFATVTLLVLVIFGQQGEVHRSPQRVAAISAGHTDRRTIFESDVFGPVMWLLLALSHRLALPRAKEWLRRQLTVAGNPNYYTPEEYLAISLLNGVLVALALAVIYLLLWSQISVVVMLIGLLAGGGLTLLLLHDKASKRIRVIAKRVPYTLDLVALAMGAGATFVEAVKTVVRERGDAPFNVELKTMLAEMELGATRRQALLGLVDRVPLESLRAIVASVVQAEELGTPLADVLRGQANLLRQQRSVQAENRAAIASVRILIPSLLIMISAVLAVFAPAILRAIRQGLF